MKAQDIWTFGSIVGGKEVLSNEWIEVFNPFTKKLVGKVASIKPETLDKIMQDTYEAKLTLSRHERYDILNKMAESVVANAEQISSIITDESGLCVKDSMYEASRVADVLRFSAIKALDRTAAARAAVQVRAPLHDAVLLHPVLARVVDGHMCWRRAHGKQAIFVLVPAICVR